MSYIVYSFLVVGVAARQQQRHRDWKFMIIASVFMIFLLHLHDVFFCPNGINAPKKKSENVKTTAKTEKQKHVTSQANVNVV